MRISTFGERKYTFVIGVCQEKTLLIDYSCTLEHFKLKGNLPDVHGERKVLKNWTQELKKTFKLQLTVLP